MGSRENEVSDVSFRATILRGVISERHPREEAFMRNSDLPASGDPALVSWDSVFRMNFASHPPYLTRQDNIHLHATSGQRKLGNQSVASFLQMRKQRWG